MTTKPDDYLVWCHGCGATWWLDYEPPRCSCVEDSPPSEIIIGTREIDHYYVSTACKHDLHARCRKTCKFCDSDCLCKCHVKQQQSAVS